MDSNFSTVLVQDPRLMVTDSIQYGVYKSASQITQNMCNANSSSLSQIYFNVAVPSETTLIDRKILVSSTVNFIITVKAVSQNQVILNLGKTDALGCFPLSSLFSTLSATINNTTVSVNLADIL